jgi:hypothetical protein
MKVENRTDLPIFLDDLINRQDWKLEYGKDFELPMKLAQPLDDWKVIIRWKNGKHRFGGRCLPSKKLIEIAVNPRNIYPLTQKWAIGTERFYTPFYGYRYVYETVTFKNPNELARFIFLHEFSHLLDYLQGLNLHRKQTRSNRFAMRMLTTCPKIDEIEDQANSGLGSES